MADVQTARESLSQVTQSTRIVIRCLSTARDSQESSQRALSLLVDLLDLVYRIKDQISWAEEKWLVEATRLAALVEILGWFESTMKSIELYFQPGGVGVCYFRKHLLERTFLPRLEQFKIMFLLAMQPGSCERSSLDWEIRESLRGYQEVESASPHLDLQFEEDALRLTSRLSSDHFITLADLCNRRHQGTCSWVFKNKRYRDWLLGSTRTLYCVGPPGAGKTFMSSAIIDSLQRTFTSPDVATVFIFCQDEKEKEQTSIDLLQNILAQLVYRKRSLSYATSALYYSESLMKGRASPKAYQNAIRAEVNRFSKVFFVIDGLDMFSEKERFLTRLQKLPDQAQLLVTLREVTHIDSQDSYMDVLASPEDVQLYTLSRIQHDAGLKDLCKGTESRPNLEWEAVRLVTERSHGVFLLAKIHLDLLSRYTDRNILERALLCLPESLSEAYGEAMKYIVSVNPCATRQVYWTLYAFRPLSVAELKYATNSPDAEVGLEPVSFEHSLLIQSAGLLAVDAVTGTVRFVHRTAKEYLNGTAARVFFPNAQKDIAEVCLTVITPDEVVDDCYTNDGTSPRSTSGGFLKYAAMYWGYHAREVAEDEQTIQVLIKTFLNKLLWRRPPARDVPKIQEIPTELGLGKYPEDWSALHILSFFGILGKAKRLLEQGAKINANKNTLGITPLHCAACRGNDEMVEFLLNHGADRNAVAKDSSTPLHLATIHGQRKAMKLLLSRNANSKLTNDQGTTSLQLAVGTAADEATVPLLVKNKVDVNVRNVQTGNTSLHLAVAWRRPRIILFLLEKGASIDVTNEEGLTPLQLAAQIDNCEAISLLLQQHAHVETRSLSGFTALQIAAHKNHWVAFDLLLIGGANINAWNKQGESLLHEQARQSSSTSIAAKLLDQGANLEIRTSQGYTPLQCAAIAGNKKMFMFLLSKGARIDVETPKGESLLHITPPVNPDCLEILSVLLNSGLNVQAISSQGWTPLHQTVYMGTGIPDIAFDQTTEYIRLLLTYGADINSYAVSETMETPLHLATMAIVPRPPLVALLLELGADSNAMTNEGKSPLHLAAERGRESIFRILLNAGADLSLEAPNSAVTDEGEHFGPGTTAFDLARKNPFGFLWFDDDGKLRPAPEKNRRDSVSTIIDDVCSECSGLTDDDDETGGSTLIGSEQPYIMV